MLVSAPDHTLTHASGQWTGFNNAGSASERRKFDVLLQFRDNRLSGVGDDDHGMFVLTGEYDPQEEECHWVQTYLFGQTLFYRGFCERGRIWGTWQDGDNGHGGFQIWPLTAGAGVEADAVANHHG